MTRLPGSPSPELSRVINGDVAGVRSLNGERYGTNEEVDLQEKRILGRPEKA